MIKVSVIVPIYNVERYLDKCLHYLINQSLEEIEIICVNDGSKDNSQKIVDQYVNQYPNKVKSLIKENGGLSDSRNYGLEYATGQFVMFIDSDDWIEEQMCETMYRTAISESADLVVCDIQNVYEDGHVAYVSCGDFKEGNIKTLPYLLTIDNSACNKLFKKTLFEDIKFPLGIWYEDLGCIPIVLSKAQRVVKVNKAFYNYFQREGSIMNTYSEKSLDIYKALQL
ncbi:MAG: glycosyltransferase family 2 protein, partial [Bacillota bacterium]|nr:glycosyltransferase family 2 protein [Bacillota bacterium]